MTVPSTLVIGANGFIGSHVVDMLAKTDVPRIVQGVRDPARLRTPTSSRILSKRISFTEVESLSEAMEGCGAVINCARFARGQDASREAMTNLTIAAERCGVSRIVHLSSVAVYGAATGDVSEDTAPKQPFSSYASDKIIAEETCKARASDNLKIAIVRPALVYGPGGDQWDNYFVRGIRSGQLTRLNPNGDGTANLIFVDDLAEFCVYLTYVRLSAFQIFNLSGDDQISFNEYFNLLSRSIFNRELPIKTYHRRIWENRRTVLKVLRKIASIPPFGKIMKLNGVMFIDDSFLKYASVVRYRNDAAKRLGFLPKVSVAEGVRRLSAYYQSVL